MRTLIAIAFLLISTCVVARVSYVLLPSNAQELYGTPTPASAVSPRAALDAVDIFPIGMGAESEMKGAVLISKTTSTLTNFGDFTSYSFPVEFDAALSAQIIQVNGYMIKPEKGKK